MWRKWEERIHFSFIKIREDIGMAVGKMSLFTSGTVITFQCFCKVPYGIHNFVFNISAKNKQNASFDSYM